VYLFFPKKGLTIQVLPRTETAQRLRQLAEKQAIQNWFWYIKLMQKVQIDAHISKTGNKQNKKVVGCAYRRFGLDLITCNVSILSYPSRHSFGFYCHSWNKQSDEAMWFKQYLLVKIFISFAMSSASDKELFKLCHYEPSKDSTLSRWMSVICSVVYNNNYTFLASKLVKFVSPLMTQHQIHHQDTCLAIDNKLKG